MGDVARCGVKTGEQRLHHLLGSRLQQFVHELLTEVATTDGPLVVLLLKLGAHQAQQRGSVGKGADHFAAATDLAVEPLQRIGGPDLPTMLQRETVKGDDVDLGLLQNGDQFREAPLKKCGSYPSEQTEVVLFAL
jgi:hypothetical protein